MTELSTCSPPPLSTQSVVEVKRPEFLSTLVPPTRTLLFKIESGAFDKLVCTALIPAAVTVPPPAPLSTPFAPMLILEFNHPEFAVMLE